MPIPSSHDILILEDEFDSSFSLSLQTLLSPLCRLHIVHQPDEVLGTLRAKRCDIAILIMERAAPPDLVLVKEIKDQDEDVQVLIVAGQGRMEFAMIAFMHGAVAYFFKHHNPYDFFVEVKATLLKQNRLRLLRAFLNPGLELLKSDIEFAGLQGSSETL